MVFVHQKTKQLVQFSLFTAIILVLQFTPIGFIHLGFIKATIIHIPVIIGSILLGPLAGALLGILFGMSSFLTNTFSPSLLSFAFSPLIPLPGTSTGTPLALLVCFLPRILVGVLPWYFNEGLKSIIPLKKELRLLLVGILGSLVNTLFVMGLIYLFFKDAYADVKNISSEMVYQGILMIVFVNGVPEAILSGVLTAGICRIVRDKPSRKQKPLF